MTEQIKVIVKSNKTGREQEGIYSIEKLFASLDDDIVDEIIKCDCEPIGETNVIECNCSDEWFDKGYNVRFELIQ